MGASKASQTFKLRRAKNIFLSGIKMRILFEPRNTLLLRCLQPYVIAFCPTQPSSLSPAVPCSGRGRIIKEGKGTHNWGEEGGNKHDLLTLEKREQKLSDIFPARAQEKEPLFSCGKKASSAVFVSHT